MKLVVVGSGSSVPHKSRTSSGYWLETGGGSLMLDFAPSVIHRMAAEGLDWANLSAIWISHFHLDHFGGLAPFLFATKHAPQTQSRINRQRIFGPIGLRETLSKFDAAYPYNLLIQPYSLDFIEILPQDSFEILPGIRAKVCKTPHTPESLAIRLESEEGKTLVYTSDTGFSREVAEFAAGADLFITEASFVRNSPVRTHISLEEALEMARIAKPKKLLLTHFYPEWDDFDLIENTRGRLECEIAAAEDGLKIEI
jgi:ribonuclease BN (tRNA processing enzyme)